MIAEATVYTFLIVLANHGSSVVCFKNHISEETVTNARSELFYDFKVHIGMFPLTIIQQKEGDYRLDLIISSLSHKGMCVVLNFEEFNEIIASQMMKRKDVERPANMEEFNFLVFSDVDGVYVMLAKAHLLDHHYGWGSLLRHMSKWLIVLTDGGCADALMMEDVLLDNVAVTTIENIGSNFTTEKIPSSVYTLMWEKGSRKLQQVSQSPSEDAITRVFPNTGYGLNGRILKAAVLNWPTCEKRFLNGTFIYSGFCDYILHHLSRVFNFSYTYVEPKDQSWGIRHPNGQWDGIIRMLIDGTADISPVPYGLSYDRSVYLTFLHSFDSFYSGIIYKKPAPRVKWDVLLVCFQWQIYACGFAVLVWVVALFYTLKKASEWLFFQRDMKSDNVFLGKIAIIFGVPFKQGSSTLPSTDSHRILFSFWWLFCILITSVYSGTFIAYLTVDKENVPFTGLGDVLDSGYNVGVYTGTVQESALKNSNISLYKRLWRKIREHQHNNMTTSEDLTYNNDQLESGRYALITSGSIIKKVLAERCDIMAAKEIFLQSYASFILPKQSALASLFDPEIMSLVERGLSKYWLDLVTPKRKRCSTEGQEAIHVEHLFLVCVVSAIGIALGTVILVSEYAMIRYHRGRICT